MLSKSTNIVCPKSVARSEGSRDLDKDFNLELTKTLDKESVKLRSVSRRSGGPATRSSTSHTKG